MKGQMHPCAFQPVPVLRSSLTPFYELHMHLAKSKLFIQKRPRNLPFALSSKREECAQPSVAQIKSCPDQHAENDRSEVGWVAHAQVACGCAAEIGGHEDRAKIRTLRNDVDERAGDLENPDDNNQTFGISIVCEPLQDWRRLQQFHNAAEEQQEHRQGTDDTSGPELFFRDGERLSTRCHECFLQANLNRSQRIRASET